MASSGESRSVFVVQRAFRRVRRGYDPEEVDRHLQLVSEWFAGSRVGETAREIEAQLRERERALAEQAAEARHLVEGARIEAEVVNDPAERNQVWGEIDRAVTEQAPGVPWLWDKQPMLKSADVNAVVSVANASWDFAFTSMK